jgi:hypothetical protein
MLLLAYLPKIFSLSERLKPSANKIFRCVCIRHGMPFSIRAIVMGDTFALRASSVLLISRDSLAFLNVLPFIKNLDVNRTPNIIERFDHLISF